MRIKMKLIQHKTWSKSLYFGENYPFVNMDYEGWFLFGVIPLKIRKCGMSVFCNPISEWEGFLQRWDEQHGVSNDSI